MQPFPESFDDWQARKAGTNVSDMRQKWADVMSDAPNCVRPGRSGLDSDGDPVIFVGPGGYQNADGHHPAGILMLYRYKGEWHFEDLSTSPDFARHRWSGYDFGE